MAEHIDDGDVDNCLVFTKKSVRQDGSKDGSEVTEHGEGVVDYCGQVLCQSKFLFQVDRKDRLNRWC